MKKVYQAPRVDAMPFYTEEAIAATEPTSIHSFPYNDGELGWT